MAGYRVFKCSVLAMALAGVGCSGADKLSLSQKNNLDHSGKSARPVQSSVSPMFWEPKFLALWLRRGGNPDQRGPAGEPLIVMAALAGKYAALKSLVKAGADPNLKDSFGSPPLMTVLREGTEEAAVQLIKAGADPCAPANLPGDSALHIAAGLGYDRVVAEAVKKPRNLNVRAFRGETPLMKAVLFGQLKCAKILYAHGAKWMDPNYDCVHYAAMIGSFPEQYRVLVVRADTDENLRPRRYAQNDAAMRKKAPEMIRFLASKGFPIDKPGKGGLTPIMLAATSHSLEAYKTLLALGANPKKAAKNKDTALKLLAEVEPALTAPTRRGTPPTQTF